MCDDEIHQGLVQDPFVSRRTFGVLSAAAAAGAAGSARAAGELVESDVDIKTADGTCDAALIYPAGKGPWPAVLIWTDIMGLRPVFRDMGRRLAAEGYVVLVPNPFYRVKHAPIIEGPFDFAKPEDRAKIMPFRASITAAGAAGDATTFVAYLDALPQVKKTAKIGVQGYCMGGPLMMYSVAAAPDRFGAGASFHGGGLVTKEADSPHLLIPKIKAKCYYGVADNDDKAQPDAKDVLKADFAAAKNPAKIEVYSGSNHGWCVKGSAAYNEPGAEKAWAELLALYKGALA